MKKYLFILGFLLSASGALLLTTPVYASGLPEQLNYSSTQSFYNTPTTYVDLGSGYSGTTNALSMYIGSGYGGNLTISIFGCTTNSLTYGSCAEVYSGIGFFYSPSSGSPTLQTINSFGNITFNPAYYYFIDFGSSFHLNLGTDGSNNPYYYFASSAPPFPSTLLISPPSFVGDSWSLNLYNSGNYDLYSNYIGVTYATTSNFSSEQYNDYKSLSSYSGSTNTPEEIDNIIIPQTALLLNTSTTYYAMPWIYFNGSYIDGTTTTFNVESNYVPSSQPFLTNATGTLGPYSWGAGLYSTSSPNALVTVTQLSTTTCDGYLDIPCELGNWSSGVFNFLFGINTSTVEFISGISLTRTAPFNIIGEIQSDFVSSSSTPVQALATTTLTFNLKGSATSSAVGFEIFGSNLLHEYIPDDLAALFRSIILTVLTVGMVYGFYRQILSLAKTNTT